MPGPETTHWNHFYSSHLVSLARGSRALHVMAFDRIYPPDQESFMRAKREGMPNRPNSYHADIRRLIDRDVHVGRLRVLPDIGDYGYSANDIQLLRNMARVAARFGGEDVRVVQRSNIEDDLADYCGHDSPLLRRYQSGLESGQPQANLWSVRQPQATGELALTAIRLTHYSDTPGDAQLAEDLLYTPPIPDDLSRFEAFWRDTFARRAERLPA